MPNTLGYNKLRDGYGLFIIQNITNPPKTLFIFNIPIGCGGIYNLMNIEGISEEDIKISLLKGELFNKLNNGEIVVISSDVNLLQYNDLQKQFLNNYISYGISAIQQNNTYIEQLNIELFGSTDGVNQTFILPNNQFLFISYYYNLAIYWNGIRQVWNSDYTINGYNGSSGYFNTIVMTIPPDPGDFISGDYFILNQ